MTFQYLVIVVERRTTKSDETRLVIFPVGVNLFHFEELVTKVCVEDSPLLGLMLKTRSCYSQTDSVFFFVFFSSQ